MHAAAKDHRDEHLVTDDVTHLGGGRVAPGTCTPGDNAQGGFGHMPVRRVEPRQTPVDSWGV